MRRYHCTEKDFSSKTVILMAVYAIHQGTRVICARVDCLA